MSTQMIVQEAEQQFENVHAGVVTTLEQAKAIQITDEISYKAAGSFGLDIKKKIKTITDAFAPTVKAADAVHKSVCALRNRALDQLKEASGITDDKMKVWFLAAKKEQEKKEAAMAEERRLAAAVEAEQNGDSEKANDILENPHAIVTPSASTPAPKIDGLRATTEWVFQVVDLNKIRDEFWIIDEPAIRSCVKKMGKKAEEIIGGIVVTEDVSFARTGRK